MSSGLAVAATWTSDEVVSLSQTYSDGFRQLVLDGHKNGLMLFSDLFPESGILVTTTPGADNEFCSASAVSPTKILTAAHCVCGGAANALACKQQIKALHGFFLSPTEGVFAVEPGGAEVPDQFHSAESEAAGPRADLALVTLMGVMTHFAEFAPFPDGDAAAYKTAASFGIFGLSKSNQNHVLDGNRFFNTGVGQTFGNRDIDHGRCPEGTPDDVLCNEVSETVAIDDKFKDAGTCSGDSGGSLFAWSGTSRAIVGVVSSNSDPRRCFDSSAFHQTASYVALTGYIDWIQARIGQLAEPPSYVTDCHDLVFAGDFSVRGDKVASIAIIPFAFRDNAAPDADRPQPEVTAAGGAVCDRPDGGEFSGWYCRLPAANASVRFVADHDLQFTRTCLKSGG